MGLTNVEDYQLMAILLLPGPIQRLSSKIAELRALIIHNLLKIPLIKNVILMLFAIALNFT